MAALTAYVWLALPPADGLRWVYWACGPIIVAFPICMNLLHGDRPADAGLRLDTLGPSAKAVAIVTAVMAGGLVIVGLASGGFHWVHWRRFGDKCAMYLVWGPVQQYLLHAFAVRRLRQAGLAKWAAAVGGAALFGLLHAPNWPLVALTTGAGLVWCSLFFRRPNLLTLGLAHGGLAVLLYHALPEEWLQNLTIAGAYLQRVASP